MSAVNAVQYLLAHNSGLLAVVPIGQIWAGLIPAGTAVPAVCVTHVSTVRKNMVSESARVCTSRVQVSVMASTYKQQGEVLALVRAALPRSRGTVNSVKLESILLDSEGPDFRNDDAGLFLGSIDYMVTFTE